MQTKLITQKLKTIRQEVNFFQINSNQFIGHFVLLFSVLFLLFQYCNGISYVLRENGMKFNQVKSII